MAISRLAAQHRLWADQAHDLWDRAAPGLALATGYSTWAADPGSRRLIWPKGWGPAGHVLAVDASVRFIGALDLEARRRGFAHLTARAERLEAFGLEPVSLDGAFARWIFCFLPAAAPVVGRVVAGLRPRGRLVVWDYLNYFAAALHPPGPAFDRVVAAVHESWRRSGGDLNVGERLPGLIAAAGCRILDLVPLAYFPQPGTPLWEWPIGFFFGYVPRLVEAGFLTEAERLDFESEWREREADPRAFLSGGHRRREAVSRPPPARNRNPGAGCPGAERRSPGRSDGRQC